jgi:hypothetical protein
VAVEQCNEPDEVHADGPRPSQVIAVFYGPWGNHMIRSLAFLACGVLFGCAHQEHLKVVEIQYPRLVDERCGSAESSIDVLVKDQGGEAIYGASTYLLPMSSSDAPLSEITDRRGVAHFKSSKGGTFGVVATLLGFLPTSQVLRFDSGCSGHVQLVLKVMS